MNTSDLKSFNYLENGDVTFSVFDTVKTVNKLDSGIYIASYIQTGTGGQLNIKIDSDTESVQTHNFSDKEKLDNFFISFFNKDVIKKMLELGFNHKAGILFYGKEGTGKSTIIKNYVKQIVEKHNAIVIYIEGINGITAQWEFVSKIRAIQDNPIIVVFEEIDILITRGLEGKLKTCLDGKDSINNCLCFGTTNYINNIPNALKDRPSRFKYSLNIEGLSDEKDIYLILENMIGHIHNPSDIIEFASELNGSTLDVIKQFCIDKIMEIKTHKPNKKKMGFNTEKK